MLWTDKEVVDSHTQVAKEYTRPLIVGLALATFGELLLFIVFGVILYPEGDLFSKFLWTVVFCGIGMGSAFGVAIDLMVVNRFKGAMAILYCTILSSGFLGIGCNVLCFKLDQEFQYFGGQHNPTLFIINGLIMATLGGFIGGWLLFTDQGKKILQKVGL